MANLGFFVLPNTGGMNACLRLASDLRDRGHHVYFLGLEDSEAHIRSNGFEFVSVFRQYFPKGSYAEHVMVNALPLGLGLFRALRELKAQFKLFFEDMLSNGADDFLETLKSMHPDLIIFASGDIYMEWPAMLAYTAGVKGIYFHDGSYTCEEEGMPPHWTTYIPTESLISRLTICLLWKWGTFKQMLTALAYKVFGLDRGVHAFSRSLARKYGYDLSHRALGGRKAPRLSEFAPSIGGKKMPRLVEFVPCPPTFRLPGARDMPGRYYIEPTIYVDIVEPVFPWNNMRENQPLIYCAMGTAVWFDKERYKQFYAFISDTAARMPDWDFVIATGRSLDARELNHLPFNVIALNYAPQVKLLKRASVAIFHGGTNTVKQCIYFGVPMIVFPVGSDLWGDSSGIAARIVYHGLGVVGDWRRCSASYLEQLVNAVGSSSFIGSQLKIMQREFRNLEELKPGLKMIEALLEGRQCGDAGSSRVIE